MEYHRIVVKLRGEGECRFRKEEMVMPKLPNWILYTWGGPRAQGYFAQGTPRPECKKRCLRKDLYYKTYHIEYWASHRGGIKAAPTQEYLKGAIELIKPCPNEVLVEKRGFIEKEPPYVHHDTYYYYKFEEIEGSIQAVFEKSKEEHYYFKKSFGKERKIPVNK